MGHDFKHAARTALDLARGFQDGDRADSARPNERAVIATTDAARDLARALHDGGDILPCDVIYRDALDILMVLHEAWTYGEGGAVGDLVDALVEIPTHDLIGWTMHDPEAPEAISEAMGMGFTDDYPETLRVARAVTLRRRALDIARHLADHHGVDAYAEA